MQITDQNNNKDGRLDLILENATVPKADQIRHPLPQNQKFGKNEHGYDILPNEGK